ncbi:hypothetical protein D3C77_622580 [compost metagenome]
MLSKMVVTLAVYQAFAHNGVTGQILHYGYCQLVIPAINSRYEIGAEAMLNFQRFPLDAGPVQA